MADLCQAPEPRPRVFHWRALRLDLCRFPGVELVPTLQGATAAIRERARIAGLDKRTVTHEVTADDFFPKEDK